MAIFPPQVSTADIERINLLRTERKRAEARAAGADDTAGRKINVVRPPLGKALSDELRRFARDERGLTFIDYAITISLVSMAAGFFIPDLWALFQATFQPVTNDVSTINTRMQMN